MIENRQQSPPHIMSRRVDVKLSVVYPFTDPSKKVASSTGSHKTVVRHLIHA